MPDLYRGGWGPRQFFRELGIYLLGEERCVIGGDIHLGAVQDLHA
jgi:hypothetical protein